MLLCRAKFIVGSVQQLLEQPEGGVSWLLSLRDKPYAEAHEALCSLPGRLADRCWWLLLAVLTGI